MKNVGTAVLGCAVISDTDTYKDICRMGAMGVGMQNNTTKNITYVGTHTINLYLLSICIYLTREGVTKTKSDCKSWLASDEAILKCDVSTSGHYKASTRKHLSTTISIATTKQRIK